MHNRNLHARDYSDSLCWLSILHGRKLASALIVRPGKLVEVSAHQYKRK